MPSSEPTTFSTSPSAEQPGGIFRDPLKLQAFLQQILKQPVRELEMLPAGWNTRVLAFQTERDALVLRISEYPQSTAKERMAHTLFAPHLPVPQVWCEGSHGSLHWAIVTRCPGNNLSTYSLTAQLQHAPQIMGLLCKLVESPLPRHQPAAWSVPLAGAEQQRPLSWTEALYALHGMRKRLHNMAHPAAWLTPERCYHLLTSFEKGLSACPATPLWWIHGDFKAANLLAQDGQITGLIDWAGLGYGDFLYDAALWFWHHPFENWQAWWPWFETLYRERGLDLSAAEIRMQTYLLHTGLGTLVALVTLPRLHRYLPFYERQLEALLAGKLRASLLGSKHL